jgi:MFS family permease
MAVSTLPDSSAATAQRSFGYAWYVTAVLMLAYTFSFLDRQILNLMIGPIRRDLGISDHEFALLAGAAFGVFYTVMALPLGWLADRFNRKWLITIGVATWSLMTATCGLARTFPQLFLARVGVGVGEATLSPSTYSTLSDYFDKQRLPRAMSVYTVGLFIGAGLALIVGGEVVTAVGKWDPIVLPHFGRLHDWQIVFMMVGLPGLALALWIATLREPQRRGRTQTVPFGEVFRFIGRRPKLFIAFFVGAGFYSVMGYADTWYPELFIRTWGWDAAQAGRINGASSLVAGPLGLLFAGWYSSYLMARGRSDACLRLTAFGALGIAIPAIFMPLMPNPTLMAVMLFPFKFFVGFPPVLIASAIQMVAPNRLRAQLGALFLFAVGIIGVTCGPILPSLFTDFVFHNDSALKYSLSLAAAITTPLAFGLLWLGLAEFRTSLSEAETESSSGAKS